MDKVLHEGSTSPTMNVNGGYKLVSGVIDVSGGTNVLREGTSYSWVQMSELVTEDTVLTTCS